MGIVNLIRNAKLDAKIDSKQGTVVMGIDTNSPYQQLIEKTKALSFRSQMLQMNIEKKRRPRMHLTGELQTSRSWKVPITFCTVSYCFCTVAQINVHDPSGNVKIRDNACELIK